MQLNPRSLPDQDSCSLLGDTIAHMGDKIRQWAEGVAVVWEAGPSRGHVSSEAVDVMQAASISGASHGASLRLRQQGHSQLHLWCRH